MNYKENIKCPECNGTGKIFEDDGTARFCHVCDGETEVALTCNNCPEKDSCGFAFSCFKKD